MIRHQSRDGKITIEATNMGLLVLDLWIHQL